MSFHIVDRLGVCVGGGADLWLGEGKQDQPHFPTPGDQWLKEASLMAQWLGLCFSQRAWVQSLVRELRPCKPSWSSPLPPKNQNVGDA